MDRTGDLLWTDEVMIIKMKYYDFNAKMLKVDGDDDDDTN